MTIQPISPNQYDDQRRMSHAEAVLLCRYAKAACPQQAFDEYTPDAWSDLLGDLRFEDCKQALTNVVKAKPFVSPAEIREAVDRIRAERLRTFERNHRIDPPSELAEDPAAEIEWRRALNQQIADGDVTHADQVEWHGGAYTAEELERPTRTPAEVMKHLRELSAGRAPEDDESEPA